MFHSGERRLVSSASSNPGVHDSTHYRWQCVSDLCESQISSLPSSKVMTVYSRKLPASAELLLASNSTEKYGASDEGMVVNRSTINHLCWFAPLVSIDQA
jgi:hypothetical protein